MSAGPEQSGDLVALACVVDASLLLASEWSRILIDYVSPLLGRLSELHPSHQFRLAFVTYGSANTRPLPLLSKLYFAPLTQVFKELRGDPAKLGIGQTNSGGGEGLSALEGLVAAIELFDILMLSTNHASMQSPQKENRSLVAHLLHIAASPPNNAQRPQCNTLQHLDFVNWDSIPAELRKRKINLSLISLREIPQFQDLQSSVAGANAQSPWFNVHAPHILLLAGFPIPQKTGAKRQPDALPSDQSPDAKRQKVVADPASKTASPALPLARIPQNPRFQQPVPPQVTQLPSTAVSALSSSPAQPVQALNSLPASTPAATSPAPPPPSGPPLPALNTEVLDQVAAKRGLKFSQMMERLKALNTDVPILDAKIANAQSTGQTAALTVLQKERDFKAKLKDQIRMLLLQHYHKTLLAKETTNAQAGSSGSAGPNASAASGPSTQPAQPSGVPRVSSERPTGPVTEEHRLLGPDSQVLAQFWQSRGGTISAPNGNNAQAGPSQAQPHPSLNSEMVAQVPKPIEKNGVRPQNFGLPSQTPGTTSHESGVTSNMSNNQVIHPSNAPAWVGSFSWNLSKLGGQVTAELQIHVVGVFPQRMSSETPPEIRTDLWPKNLILNPCKEPVKDNAELLSWLRRHQGRVHVMRFEPNPRAPDATTNEQRFQALNKSMREQRISAYAGWQLPSGKFSHNIFIFPTEASFAGAMFPDGLPDLPGSGNALEVQPSAGERKPQLPLSGSTFPPALMARMQGLEPAKQRQLFAHFIRMQQQEQLRRQQLQQTQQAHTASGQAMNPVGMSIPQNPYSAVANIPMGLHGNATAPAANTGAYNAAGGTVNYEMLQSFMQRNADGSTSRGMNSGSMP